MTALEEIKKALEGVTPGPWELCAHLKYNDACSCGYRGVIYGPEPDGFAICQPGHEPAPEGQEGTEPPRYTRDVEIANMRYIAAVNPVSVSELLYTIESFQRGNETVDALECALQAAVGRAEAAEAEVNRLREALGAVLAAHGIKSVKGKLLEDVIASATERARTALASTGEEHHAE